MAEDNKADKLAGKSSLADRLRRKRIAIEAGDLDAAARIGQGEEMPEDSQYGSEEPASKRKKKRPGTAELLIGEN